MRIKEKIDEINNYLSELEEITPSNFKEYCQIKNKAACERYLEKIIEAVIDLSFLIIKKKEFKIPEKDAQAFDILKDEKIITDQLSKKLKQAKGMRNLLAHEYGSIDNQIVFESITTELSRDVKEFLKRLSQPKTL